MIGVMSDSHDNRESVQRAVRLFNETRCELVVHAGDFVAPFAAAELAALTCPLKAVFGNCDGEKKGLKRTIRPFGEIQEAPFLFAWNGERYLLSHLDRPLRSYISQYDVGVIFYGHTHRPEVRFQGNTLLINPGETGGWVSGRQTVALFDPKEKTADIVPL